MLNIDNLIIEINASELPGLDGSAKPYVEALLAAQIQPSDEPRRRLVIHDPVVVRKDDAMLANDVGPSADAGRTTAAGSGEVPRFVTLDAVLALNCTTPL